MFAPDTAADKAEPMVVRGLTYLALVEEPPYTTHAPIRTASVAIQKRMARVLFATVNVFEPLPAISPRAFKLFVKLLLDAKIYVAENDVSPCPNATTCVA